MYRVLAIAVACASVGASAKCAQVPYLVRGAVTNELGKPIAGATVVISWGEFDGGHSRTVATSGDGAYVAELSFYPYSGQAVLGGDLCERRLASVNVAVAASGHKRTRSAVRIANGAAVANYTLASE